MTSLPGTTPRPEPGTPSRPRRIAIACQGGGSHTAFGAGVLARFFESGALDGHEVVGISGTSGGAINAVLTWQTLVQGRPDRVGEVLEAFWADNSARTPPERLLNAMVVAAGLVQNLGLAPPLNPYWVPPIFDGRVEFTRLLGRHIDFDALPADPEGALPLLVLGAVEVLSGRFRAFDSRRDRITADSVLASAAIPTLFRAVRTDGGAYWDGLFSQNPPVSQLVATHPDEVWVIQINPSRVGHEPRTPVDIADRREELAGNLSLYQELGTIETIDRLLDEGYLTRASGYRPIVVRVLEMPRAPGAEFLGSASKANRDTAFLATLRREGREQADRFLTALRFERSWVAGDVEAVLEMIGDAPITVEAPFRQGTGDTPADVSKLLTEGVHVDANRKQVAGGEVRWSIRLQSDRTGAFVDGTATATFTGTHVRALHLGPPT